MNPSTMMKFRAAALPLGCDTSRKGNTAGRGKVCTRGCQKTVVEHLCRVLVREKRVASRWCLVDIQLLRRLGRL